MQNFLDFAKETALEAGKLIFKKKKTAKLLDAKDDGFHSVLTEADLASETLIRKRISEVFPDHAILGEEEGLKEDPQSNSEYMWIIDPIDGTNNYSRGDIHYSVSIGLRKNGKAIVGAICVPELNELYYASEGTGAYVERNGEQKKLQVSGKSSLNMFTMGFGSGVDFYEPEKAENFMRDLREANLFKTIRRRTLESAAIELCYVAEGKWDAFLCNWIKPWDFVAAEIILNEAGGKFISFNDAVCLGSNGEIHEEIIELMKKHLTL